MTPTDSAFFRPLVSLALEFGALIIRNDLTQTVQANFNGQMILHGRQLPNGTWDIRANAHLLTMHQIHSYQHPKNPLP